MPTRFARSSNSNRRRLKMNRSVTNHGGNLVRILQALDGFKGKYGAWPSELHISQDTIDTIKNFHLTASGYRRLNGFVNIVVSGKEDIIAKGAGRRIFNYSTEGWERPEPEVGVAELLGFDA